MRTGEQATGHGLEVAKMVHNGGGTAGHYRQGAVSGHLATSAPGLGLRTLKQGSRGVGRQLPTGSRNRTWRARRGGHFGVRVQG